MSLSPHSTRTVTELDHVRIDNMMRRMFATADTMPAVATVLEYADLVPSQEIGSDVVTMYSRVAVSDQQTGERRELTLCYPQDADAATGFVSVLSPVGGALLGVTVGTSTSWTTPDGRTEGAKVLEILFQPEANGEYTK